MAERDIDTEPLIRRTASECGRNGTPCLYEQDRDQLASASRRLERKMDGVADTLADIRATLASGSVRFEALADIPKRVSTVESAQHTLVNRLTLIEKIVFGACIVVGVGVLTAGLALVIKVQ